MPVLTQVWRCSSPNWVDFIKSNYGKWKHTIGQYWEKWCPITVRMRVSSKGGKETNKTRNWEEKEEGGREAEKEIEGREEVREERQKKNTERMMYFLYMQVSKECSLIHSYRWVTKRPTSGGLMRNQEEAVQRTFHIERSSFYYYSVLMVRTQCIAH